VENFLRDPANQALPKSPSHKVYLYLTVILCRGGFKMNSQQLETLKIVIEEVSDHFRVFNTNFELTALPGLQISRYELSEEAEWSALAMEAVQLPGVETVMLRPYGLGIHKAVAFEWDSISPAVKQLLLWVGNTFGLESSQHSKPVKRTGKTVHVEA
jgi:hypothetical protein